MNSSSSAARDALWLRVALAFVWLATGLSGLLPEQRFGKEYLPDWLLRSVYLFAVLLGLRVLLGRSSTWVSVLQASLIVTFTVLLGWIDPRLLADPLGVLTKNVPLLAMVGTQWLLEREGWTARARWLLRGGMASIWLLEGLLPCALVQAPKLRDLLTHYGMGFGNPGLVLFVTGCLQALSAVLALVLRGWPLRLVLAAHVFGLATICVLITGFEPPALTSPLGPVTKNLAILLGTIVVSSQSAEFARPGLQQDEHP